MNLQSILKKLFPTPPTLEEFIAAHEPVSVYHVEQLEREYEKLVYSSAFWT